MRPATVLGLVLPLAYASLASAFVWPSTVDRVERDLASDSVPVRRKAARALSDLSPSVIKRIGARAMTDADPEVRVLALEALFETRASGIGERVAPWLADSDPRVRKAAAVALGKDPWRGAVPALGRVLSDPDAGVRVSAATALGASGDASAVVPLLGRLDDSNPEVREAVIRSLSRLGHPSAVVPLVGKIQDNRPSVRRAVAMALGDLGDPRASSALVLLLRDADEIVRAAALDALGRIHAVDAVATIVAMFEDERRPVVREAALEALGAIPSDAGIDALIGALSTDDPRERSPVRQALVHAGARAVPKLAACLQGQPSFDLADGCALALGEMRAREAVDVIDAALRRGIVRPQAALRALGASRDPRGLVTVLEQLAGEDPWVRRAAIEAGTALLDPSAPDGRAVEPIARALDAAHGKRAERNALVTLLGRTGSPRAVPLLSAFAADTTDASLRLSAVQALGLVGRAGQDAPLLAALSDKEASIRLAAALSLRKFGSRTSSAPLLDRLERAAEEDRGALGLALAGPLSVTRDAAVLARAATVLATSDGPSRDVLIDAFGAVPGENGSHPLVSLSPRADAPTRAKIAEALGAHPESIVALSTLAADADDAVRANAVWSLGIIGGVRAVPVLSRALADRDPSVRGNAAAALGYAGTNDKATAGSLCRAAEDDRAYVRANALAALALVKSRCASAVERQLLTRDSSDIVRAAAGRLLSSVPSAESSTDQAVLARCRADDPSGRVASACTPSKESVSPEVAARVSVFVVPSGATEPGARAPFALARGDGTLRLGLADRSGMVTEVAAPKGVLHLEIPTPLSE